MLTLVIVPNKKRCGYLRSGHGGWHSSGHIDSRPYHHHGGGNQGDGSAECGCSEYAFLGGVGWCYQLVFLPHLETCSHH